MASNYSAASAVSPRVLNVGLYADQTEEVETSEFVIPEDLTSMTDEELTALSDQAVETFNSIYGDGTGLTTEQLTALGALTEGIERISAEEGTRREAQAEHDAAAAELAARVRAASDEGVPEDDGDEDEEDDEEEGEENPPAEVATTEAIAASTRPREIRVNTSSLVRQSRPAAAPTAQDPQTMRDIAFAAGDGNLYAAGTGVDTGMIAAMVDRRLSQANVAQLEAARARGQHVRQVFSLATIQRPRVDDLYITSADPEHVQDVLTRATDESRLPGGNLAAAGGWCAPSEVRYDLCELESRDGLLSIPSVGVSRGGFQYTMGPDFATLFNEITGFHYTEAEDIAGDYDGTGTAGTKPCYHIECPDEWINARLAPDGVCITAGLLQRRGFPELIARVVRGALVAHDHRMAARAISAMVTGSTAVSFPTGQVGALAPILGAIELQAEHIAYQHRLRRGTTLEAVFPFWVRGVVRADLSRRNATDVFSVTDAQIDGWFRSRGINPQFVYNWQDLAGTPAQATAWPNQVTFLMYPAGTWVRGEADVITLDNVYDSVLLGHNDYTALFTEEATLVAKMCHDSRVITVPFCPDGATAAGVDIACNGTAAV